MSDADRPGSLSSRLGAHSSSAMVVEDEPDIAIFLGAFFRASGLDLVHLDPTAPDEVVERVIRERVGCVLLDLRLRGMTGFDVLAALRAEPSLSGLPVIIVSADDSADARARATALGVSDFVTKPFQVKDLFAKTAVLLQPSLAEALDRSALHAKLARRIRQADRAGRGATLALLRLRLDGVVPPAYALDRAAAALARALGEGVVLGSSGADELAVVLDVEQAGAVERLGAEVATAVSPLRARTGLAAYPDHAGDADGWYMAADAALDDAEENGVDLAVAR